MEHSGAFLSSSEVTRIEARMIEQQSHRCEEKPRQAVGREIGRLTV
jgi:hypothetical protein